LAGDSPKGTYFPHGSDEAAFKQSLSEKCKKVPEPIRAAIVALEPYHGGKSYLLRVLHDLNIVDKHRDLISVGAVLRKLTIVDQHLKLTFAVTFTDVEAIEGESVTQVLNQACELVSRTVTILQEAMVAYQFCAGLSERH
jgi:hypothetical protein